MITIKRINEDDPDFEKQMDTLCDSASIIDSRLTDVVSEIIDAVKQRGDDALIEFTNKFDQRQVKIDNIEVPLERLQAATDRIPAEMLQSLRFAAERIRSYHERQKIQSWKYQDKEGFILGQQLTPLDRVGIYVPGGKAAYPSTVLMNVIPAKIAEVGKVIMVVPALRGELNELVLATAYISDVDRVFTIGGAQAVAAMAFGTATIPKVDKIVGPGNRYVATAKRLVFGEVGIDMIAGPSEVLILNDGSGNPDWIAMDMFAQAEHDEDARAILVGTNRECIDRISGSIDKLLPQMDRSQIIKKSLEKHGAVIHVSALDLAVKLINKLAPEHVQLSIRDPQSIVAKIRHAGAIFMGHYAAGSLGDYCAGPSHVLPTSGSARFSSPLGVYDFQKRTSVIMCDEESAVSVNQASSVMARGEGLIAHALSAEYRMADLKKIMT